MIKIRIKSGECFFYEKCKRERDRERRICNRVIERQNDKEQE